jgi:hypothetical protein
MLGGQLRSNSPDEGGTVHDAPAGRRVRLQMTLLWPDVRAIQSRNALVDKIFVFDGTRCQRKNRQALFRI